MTSVRKFQFEPFLEPTALVDEPSLPPPPLFTLEEKDTAYQKGYHEGFAQGEKEAFERELLLQESQTQAIVMQLEKQAQELVQEMEKQKKNMISQVITLVRHIFEKLFPILEKKFSDIQIQEMIQNVIASEAPPNLKVTLHPHLVSILKTRFQISEPLIFEADGTFDLSTCRIEWQNSGLERIVPKIITDIEMLLKSFENIFEESSKQ